MSYLGQLNRTVQQAIEVGRIGRPVFVRLTITAEGTSPDRLGHLLPALSAVVDWVTEPVGRLYARPSPGNGLLAVILQFRSGATAVVSTVLAGPGGPGIDLLMLGNHGALYHDGLAVRADVAELGPQPEFKLDPALRRALEESLRSGNPQEVR